MGIELSSVGEIDVQPAVIVVIEEGQPAALGFNDVALVIGASPDVWNIEAGFAGDVYELNRRGRKWARKGRVEDRRIPPFPEWSCERIQ